MKLSKRIFDLVLASAGLIVLIPLFLIIAFFIKREDKGPIFFVQERIGYKGKPFKFYKFRSMITGAEKLGLPLTIEGDHRITKIGNILRRFKLDELPQLFNVIRGDMSLVGPRPEVPYFVKKYDDKQREVLRLVPGITDPASILYCDESVLLKDTEDPEAKYVNIIMPKKIDINLNYAKNANIVTDFVIILRTLHRIVGNRN
ncbi:MAG: sugar transferase [Candidatus Aminicenantes bacterium]|nr:sugar transferase [Candidatus Aminicenantes bacterium]